MSSTGSYTGKKFNWQQKHQNGNFSIKYEKDAHCAHTMLAMCIEKSPCEEGHWIDNA